MFSSDDQNKSCIKKPSAERSPHALPLAQKLSAQTLSKRLDKTRELPTLPSVAIQVNQMLEDIETPAQQLARVIELDQAIAPKLLKLVNSAFFGFSSKVSSVSHAVMLLGFNTVRNALLSITVIDILGVQKKLPGFDIRQFWRHAVGVAVSTSHLDKQTGGRHRESAFTAGLIHDIGKIVMAQFFPEQMALVLEDTGKQQINFLEAEKRYFAMGHAAMGAYLAKRWNLPDAMTQAVKRHHNINHSDDALALLVHAADALVNTHLIQGPEELQWPICQAAWKLLGQQIQTVQEWMPALNNDIDGACKLFLEE